MSRPTQTRNRRVGALRDSSVAEGFQAAGAARSPKTTVIGESQAVTQAAGAARVNPDLSDDPRTTDPDACKLCHLPVNWSSLALQCDGCDVWSHKQCLNMSNHEFHHIEEHCSQWLCYSCGFRNFHTSLFNTELLDSSVDSNFTIDLECSPGAPIHSSSPSIQHPRQNSKPAKLKIVNVNCQSLWAKRLEFNHMLDCVNPDVVIGTESWLNNDIVNFSVFPTDHYNIYRRDRGSRGGGVFIMVKNTILSTREEDLETNCEIVWCKINIQRSKTLFVGAYYRPHENDEDSTIQLESSLRRLHNSSSHIVLGGDFNAPGWDWANAKLKETCRVPQLYNTLIGTLDDCGLQQMVEFPTRGKNTLDLICTNAPGKIGNIDSLPGISDHNIVSCTMSIMPQRRVQKPRWIRKYGKADWTKLASEIGNIKNQITIDAEEKSTEQLWTSFKEELVKQMDKHIPKKMSKNRRKIPYITPDIEKLIRRRDRIYKKMKRGGEAFDRSRPQHIKLEEEFRNIKKDIQKSMRRAYWTYIDNIVTPPDENTENETNKYQGMKKFWQFIKSNKKDQQGVATLKTAGKISSTAIDKANTLNHQFQSVFNPLQQPTNNLQEPSQHPTSPPIEITTTGIAKLLKKLKPHKAAGPDEIPSRVLKELAHEIAPILQVIFTKSYASGEIPADWKNANVVPVFKKGKTSDPANYRPISLTCICCKIMEHIIASNIMRHARSNKIIYQLQHGFLDKRSCETQLLEFQTDILGNLQKNEQTDVLIMDFSKAFDKVSHTHLVQKLHHYGVKGQTARWIQEFLSDRKQCVVVEGEKSKSAPVTSGVPQGSVLGPPLFLYYINDIAESLSSTVRLFADDTIAYLTIKNTKDAKVLQEDIKKLENWENKWLMEFHPQKCEVLSITKNRNTINHPYTLHGHLLKHADCAKYLGVTISKDFRWATHIDNITTKASKSLGFSKRNLQVSSPSIKERAYKALVRPHLEYCPCIWDPFTSKEIDKIEMVQRRSARYVLNRYHNTSSVNEMLRELKWPSLQDRRQHARLTMLYKVTNNLVETPRLAAKFIPVQRRSRHQNEKAYQIPETPKNYIKESFIPRTIRVWNYLPNNIVTAKSIDIFRQRLLRNS